MTEKNIDLDCLKVKAKDLAYTSVGIGILAFQKAEMPAINRPTPTVSVPSGRGMRLVFVGCDAEIDDVGSVNVKQADITCWLECRCAS